MSDYLILASNFNRYAGPNNKLLDLCNYLYSNLKVNFIMVTHRSKFQRSFLKQIRFPIYKLLRGSSIDYVTRLTYAPFNVNIIKKITSSLRVPSQNIFVNSSVDTLFEAYWATHTKLNTGHNVLLNNLKSPLFHLMDRVAVKHIIKKIAANTHFQKMQYMKLGIEEEKIQIVPTCIDKNRIEKIIDQIPNKHFLEGVEKPIIFYGGRLIVEKGLKNLISCYEHLLQKIPATLMLIGDGPLKEWIIERKNKIERRNKKSNIILSNGWQPPEVYLGCMAQADLVVLPSYFEWCPIVLLEAMSLKKAVVTTQVGGIPETIKDHVNGILVNPNDKIQLEGALVELLSDSNLTNRLGCNALQTIKEKHDVSIVAPRFLQFMERDEKK